MKRILPCLLLLLAAAARADLVAQFTFARDDLLEAKVGANAKEVNGRNSATLSDAVENLTRVEDAAVLGDRTGVVAVPSSTGIAVPNPGLEKTWTMVLHYYAPASANWRCFFTRSMNNTGDGSLFIRSNTQAGQGGYTAVGDVVGAWHQVVVSHSSAGAEVWHDATKLNGSWGWSLSGLDWIYFSLDNDGEDALTYYDEIRLYDESRPADLFPDGAAAPVAIETDRDEPDGTAPAVFFF